MQYNVQRYLYTKKQQITMGMQYVYTSIDINPIITETGSRLAILPFI